MEIKAMSKNEAREHRRRMCQKYYSQLSNPYHRLTRKTQRLIVKEKERAR